MFGFIFSLPGMFLVGLCTGIQDLNNSYPSIDNNHYINKYIHKPISWYVDNIVFKNIWLAFITWPINIIIFFLYYTTILFIYTIPLFIAITLIILIKNAF
jgi:hypothetical protein